MIFLLDLLETVFVFALDVVIFVFFREVFFVFENILELVEDPEGFDDLNRLQSKAGESAQNSDDVDPVGIEHKLGAITDVWIHV